MISTIYAARARTTRLIILFALVGPLSSQAADAEDGEHPYDVALLGGLVVDGTGVAARYADIGIIDGRIERVGNLAKGSAAIEIDVAGLVVSPGFIDVHSHAEVGLVDPALRANAGYITQGVTTTVFGVDGDYSHSMLESVIDTLEAHGTGTNFMFYVGHNGIRADVLGMLDSQPSPNELELMKDQVRRSMDIGALGLSSGLMYPPSRFAKTDELIELVRETAKYGGAYDSHIRDPADDLLGSIRECLDIASHAGVRAHPAHLKAVGKNNFGASKQIVELINEHISGGLDVTADVYPYDGAAARKLVTILVPPESDPMRDRIMQLANGQLSDDELRNVMEEATRYWQQNLGDEDFRASVRSESESPTGSAFSWINTVGYGSFRVVVSDHAEYLGRMIVDIAEEDDKHPFDVIADLIILEGDNAKITLGAIDEHDLQYFLLQPWVMISSDGKITGMSDGGGHPRYRGSFPRVLARYVRELNLLSLVEAIRKMTSLPASYLRLHDRGIIREGYVADITVFDPDRIEDRATWKDPSLYSVGVVHVIVNGQFALQDEEMTGQVLGEYLRNVGNDRSR